MANNKWSGLSFDNYMKLVDAEMVRHCGMDHMDLPDFLYADAHEEGVNPAITAKRAIRAAKGESNGWD